ASACILAASKWARAMAAVRSCWAIFAPCLRCLRSVASWMAVTGSMSLAASQSLVRAVAWARWTAKAALARSVRDGSLSLARVSSVGCSVGWGSVSVATRSPFTRVGAGPRCRAPRGWLAAQAAEDVAEGADAGPGDLVGHTADHGPG